MTQKELMKHDYVLRIGFGSWTVFHSKDPSQLRHGWKMRRIVAQGVMTTTEYGTTENDLDRLALKAAIGAASADFVKRRIERD